MILTCSLLVMEARGKERDVAVLQCEDPELLAGSCQVT